MPASNKEAQQDRAFRFALRQATADRHAALDGHPALAALAAGTLDFDGYRRLMILFHSFYADHDPLLMEACRLHALDRWGFSYAPRTARLAADISSLGISNPDSVGGSRSLATVTSPGELAGTLYVLEGSMLGGGILSRSTAALLGGRSGDSYWRWCREASGARWAATCLMIEEMATNPSARDKMIAAAETAFDTFADYLRDWDSSAWSISRC